MKTIKDVTPFRALSSLPYFYNPDYHLSELQHFVLYFFHLDFPIYGEPCWDEMLALIEKNPKLLLWFNNNKILHIPSNKIQLWVHSVKLDYRFFFNSVYGKLIELVGLWNERQALAKTTIFSDDNMLVSKLDQKILSKIYEDYFILLWFIGQDRLPINIVEESLQILDMEEREAFLDKKLSHFKSECFFEIFQNTKDVEEIGGEVEFIKHFFDLPPNYLPSNLVDFFPVSDSLSLEF